MEQPAACAGCTDESDVVTMATGVEICVNKLEHSVRQTQSTESISLTSKQKTVLMIGACLCSSMCLGFSFSLTTLYVDIIDHFEAPRSQASLVQSLCIGIMFGSGLFTGPLLEHIGVRWTILGGGMIAFLGLLVTWFAKELLHLIISLGVIVGIGNGLLYIGSSVMVARTFTARRSQALQTLMTAGGAGMITLPYLLEYLVNEYGLLGCLLIVSCIYLNIIVVGLLTTSPVVIGATQSKDKTSGIQIASKLTFLKKPLFITFIPIAFIGFGTQNSFSVSMLDFLQSRGFSKETGVQWFLVFAVINTAVRIVLVFLTLLTKMKGINIFCCSLIICAGSMLILGNLQNHTLISAMIPVFAIGYGGIIGNYPNTVVEIVGLESFPLALGIGQFFNGVANPVGAAVMGAMYDHLRSYNLPFTIYGSVSIAAAGLCLAIVWTRQYRSRFQVFALK